MWSNLKKYRLFYQKIKLSRKTIFKTIFVSFSRYNEKFKLINN